MAEIHDHFLDHDAAALAPHDADTGSRSEPAGARRPGRGLLRRLLGALSWLLVGGSLVALLVFGVGPQTGAYRTLTVLSGSMVPAFHPGDVVIAQKKAPRDVKVGDIIVFNEPVGNHHVTTHRVVRIYSRGELPLVQTRGDANNADDPFKLQVQGNELWYVRAHVPWFGYVIHALRQPLLQVLAFGCIALLGLVFLWQIWFGGNEDEDEFELEHGGT